mgnify:CR=1 FL=1
MEDEESHGSSTVVIAVLALGGVMGGGNSEVSESTTDLFVEVALFDPRAVRRTARRLGLALVPSLETCGRGEWKSRNGKWSRPQREQGWKS